MQEVAAEEDSALEEQEDEADAVPDDAGFLHRQRAVLALVHILGWQRREEGGAQTGTRIVPPAAFHQWGLWALPHSQPPEERRFSLPVPLQWTPLYKLSRSQVPSGAKWLFSFKSVCL